MLFRTSAFHTAHSSSWGVLAAITKINLFDVYTEDLTATAAFKAYAEIEERWLTIQ